MPITEIKLRCLDDLTDQKRLQRRLELRGYVEKRITGDGNCQFCAIAHQVYNDQDKHDRVRKEIIKELKSNPNPYKEFRFQYEEYVKNMSNDAVWGDDITLAAAATVYGAKIVVIQSRKTTPSFEILPRSGKAHDKVIHLSFLTNLHYNSIHLRKGACTGKENKEKEKNKEEKQKEEKKEEKKKMKEEKKKDKENKNKRENMDKKSRNKFHRQSHFSVGMSVPLEGEEEEEVEKLCRRFRLTDFMW
ncbi:unnamed protein product [Microthlaspi erraticum]|uniref:OTU domain-containing protein n=1 Tax=Microthlaspi erraticum TaxID=1685480 RepID=A0A6D2KVI6_9BRAS|nr:unnamed protein product [Microthlaspi erraticum]